jgi:ribose-phosphate pyrophosphokinase
VIVKTEVPDISKYVGKKFLIIDDICDGGRTFIELVKAIQEQLPDAECYLCVTHGIFSAGLKELNKYFKGIFCTNSYSDMESPEFSLANDNQLHKLHQLNIF